MNLTPQESFYTYKKCFSYNGNLVSSRWVENIHLSRNWDFKRYTLQKKKFSIKDFFSKCDQIPSFLWIFHIYRRNPKWKSSFFVQCYSLVNNNTVKHLKFLFHILNPCQRVFTPLRKKFSFNVVYIFRTGSFLTQFSHFGQKI